MKEILVYSKMYGNKITFVDDEDFEHLSKQFGFQKISTNKYILIKTLSD